MGWAFKRLSLSFYAPLHLVYAQSITHRYVVHMTAEYIFGEINFICFFLDKRSILKKCDFFKNNLTRYLPR